MYTLNGYRVHNSLKEFCNTRVATGNSISRVLNPWGNIYIYIYNQNLQLKVFTVGKNQCSMQNKAEQYPNFCNNTEAQSNGAIEYADSIFAEDKPPKSVLHMTLNCI